MEAVHEVTVSADLPGSVEKIRASDSGRAVHAGDVLVELDTSQERAQLASLEAQRELARANFTRTQQLLDAGVISRMEFDQLWLSRNKLKPMSEKFAPPSSARRSALHSRESSGFAK